MLYGLFTFTQLYGLYPIIIGSLIILCILISRGYDIYVILIPILTILASLINLFCDIKKHK
ncbi:hypothetical protein [Staphylococcus aureus]|uniref:hypothetical protein n=1 Tax=Staphylococcus aureus TaxID=1280 RepID=UPI00069F5DEC|nr:hypothetical protein [Staphylococcus aureus]